MIKNILILILIISTTISCSNEKKKEIPKAVKGVLDLRNWNFEKDGNIKLDGEWEFVWTKFFNSNDFNKKSFNVYQKVPGYWYEMRYENEILPEKGYCSYRLKILMKDNIKSASFTLTDVSTAYRVYVNDSLMGGNGIVGKSEKESEPQFKSNIYTIKDIKDTTDLIFHVSNYHYRVGGIWFPVYLGKSDQINYYVKFNSLTDALLAGGFLLVGLNFIFLYILKNREKNFLYFGLVCIFTFLRCLTTNQNIITDIFPQISWFIQIKIELVSFFLIVLWSQLYVDSLFKGLSNKYFVRIVAVIAIISSIFGIIIPVYYTTKVVQFMKLVTIIFVIYSNVICFKAIKRNFEGSILIFISFCLHLFSVVQTFLFLEGLISTFDSSVLSLTLFLIMMSFILSRRYTNAFTRIENFARELEITVKDRTNKLQLEKEKSDKLLLNVLPEQIASRLKLGENPIADHFDEASVVFIDIVDFTKSSSTANAKRVVEVLNSLYTKLDYLAQKHGLEKIKTIGDCYMAAAGVPIAIENSPEKAANFAIEAMELLKDYDTGNGTIINFRCGIDCGPVVAGVIGEQKFIYDLWGDMVNTASRMESNGVPGKIQVTERFKEKIVGMSGNVSLHDRGEIEIKGKGKMKTWFLEK